MFLFIGCHIWKVAKHVNIRPATEYQRGEWECSARELEHACRLKMHVNDSRNGT
jgi:hypothetical protein